MAEAPKAAETGPALGPLESLAAIKAALSKVAQIGWDDSTIGVRGAVKAAQPSTQSLAQAYAMRGVARPGDSPQTAVKSKHGRQKPPPLPGKHSRALQAVPLATGSDDAGHAAGGGGGNAAEAAKKRYLLPRKRWGELPEWISLPNERGRSLPRLEVDPLFEAGPPCLLPFRPPAGAPTGRGAVVVCPGGNYEFLHPREGPPIAAWLSEAHGVPSFVLRYRDGSPLKPDLQRRLADDFLASCPVRSAACGRARRDAGRFGRWPRHVGCPPRLGAAAPPLACPRRPGLPGPGSPGCGLSGLLAALRARDAPGPNVGLRCGRGARPKSPILTASQERYARRGGAPTEDPSWRWASVRGGTSSRQAWPCMARRGQTPSCSSTLASPAARDGSQRAALQPVTMCHRRGREPSHRLAGSYARGSQPPKPPTPPPSATQAQASSVLRSSRRRRALPMQTARWSNAPPLTPAQPHHPHHPYPRPPPSPCPPPLPPLLTPASPRLRPLRSPPASSARVPGAQPRGAA